MRFRRSPQSLSDALAELYAPVTLDAFPAKVMRVMRMVIDSDINSYTEVNPARGRVVGSMDVPAMDENEAASRMGRFLHQHPLVQHFVRTGDPSAKQITDFLGQKAFESLGIYAELYQPMRMRKQMAITIASSGSGVLGAIVNRGSRDFTVADRQMLDMLGRHLTQAYQNAELATRLEDERAALSAAAQNVGLGVILLDGEGEIVSLSQRADELLQHIDARAGSPRVLPVAVLQWFRHLLSRPIDGRAVLNRISLPYAGGASVMIVRSAGSPRPGRHTLVLEPDPAAIRPGALVAAGLTNREAEVLQWIAQGKTNNDIASILGTSPRTVQKHVERLFQKLNVETRIAAVARVREL